MGIREDFLQQNGFSDWDYMCPLIKTVGMMRVIVKFHDLAQGLMARSSGDNKIGWADIYKHLREQFNMLTQLKFHPPKSSDSDFKAFFDKSCDEMEAAFVAYEQA